MRPGNHSSDEGRVFVLVAIAAALTLVVDGWHKLFGGGRPVQLAKSKTVTMTEAAHRGLGLLPKGLLVVAVVVALVLVLAQVQHASRRQRLAEAKPGEARAMESGRAHRVASTAWLVLGAVVGGLLTGLPQLSWWTRALLSPMALGVGIAGGFVVGKSDPVSGEPQWLIALRLLDHGHGPVDSEPERDARTRRIHMLMLEGAAGGLACDLLLAALRFPGGDVVWVAAFVALLSTTWSVAGCLLMAQATWTPQIAAATGAEKLAAVTARLGDDGMERVDAVLLPAVLAGEVYKSAEVLRLSLGDREPDWVVSHDGIARRITVRHVGPDPLAVPISAIPIPSQVDLRVGPQVGLDEHGEPWHVPFEEAHTLLAGATGAGKGSVIWSAIRGLVPAIEDGRMVLWGCDLKGGVEFTVGKELFERLAYTPDEALKLLEDAVAVMAKRLIFLRETGGRKHIPTADEPILQIFVDELAAVTAYISDKKLRDKLDGYLSVILSQGRAPGVLLFGALQDPRKDVVPQRDLFPRRILLRINNKEMIDHVLQDGAAEAGAHADLIDPAMPGTGYVVAPVIDEDGRVRPAQPVRVRAAWVTDEEIREMAARVARARDGRPPAFGKTAPSGSRGRPQRQGSNSRRSDAPEASLASRFVAPEAPLERSPVDDTSTRSEPFDTAALLADETPLGEDPLPPPPGFEIDEDGTYRFVPRSTAKSVMDR